jgi:hypothetical protein
MSMKIPPVKEGGGGEGVLHLLLKSEMEIMFICKHKLPPTLKE